MNLIEIKKQNQPAIQGLSNLATAILKENYDPIIGVRQNDYMLKKFQSVQALTKRCEQNYRYFLVSDKDNKKICFIGYYPRENDLYLSKFYLKKNSRGRGIAKKMFEFVKNQARQLSVPEIVLNVNKNNTIAIRAYENFGMIKIDISNDYYMDDNIY